jgi:hypothetical protein
MEIKQIDNQLNELETSVIKTLLYSGVFDYPLTEDEIFRFCGTKISDYMQLKAAIGSLLNKNLLYQDNEYYHLKESGEPIGKRLRTNRLSKRYLPVAVNLAKTLFRFPFVRGVCISGSLSKNNFDYGNDVDFFIISERKRLWLIRLMMTLYRKLLGPQRKFLICTNYFIEKGSVVNPMNLFTAIELATLIPTCGRKTGMELLEHNQWIKDYFPNYNFNLEHDFQNEQTDQLKRFIELICIKQLFDFLDYLIMKIVIRRKKWQIATNRATVPNKETFFNTVNRKIVRMNFTIDDNQSRILNHFELARKEFETTKRIKLFVGNE